jgi:DNA repair exonuclease SbcCD nuclease subunit
VIRVAVGHGSVDTVMIADPMSAIRHETLTAALDVGKVHFIALGDRHSATEVDPRIWYSGAPEPTDFDEIDPGQVLVVEIDDVDSRKPPVVTRHKVGTWCFLEERPYLDGAASIEALEERLMKLPHKDRTVLKLVVTGTLSVREAAEFEVLCTELDDVFASVVDSGRTDLAVRPEDGDFASLGLTGFAAFALDDLRAQAGSDDPGTARTATDALGLLVRLAGRPA